MLKYNGPVQRARHDRSQIRSILFNLEYARENKIYSMLDYNIEMRMYRLSKKEWILYRKNMNQKSKTIHPTQAVKLKNTIHGNFYRFHYSNYATDEGTDFIPRGRKLHTRRRQYYPEYVHRINVLNRSNADRWHFVADVWDLDGNFSIGKFTQEAYASRT